MNEMIIPSKIMFVETYLSELIFKSGLEKNRELVTPNRY